MFLLGFFLYYDVFAWLFLCIHSLLVLPAICIEYMNYSVQPRNIRGLKTDIN